MNISRIIAFILYGGGIIMVFVLILAMVMWYIGDDPATLLVKIGVVIAMATPFAGVTAAMILLIKKGETKYGLFALALLILIIFTVFWRMLV